MSIEPRGHSCGSSAPDVAKATERLILLHPVDIAIIVMYFLTVLGIGFYLKRYTKTGEDFSWPAVR